MRSQTPTEAELRELMPAVAAALEKSRAFASPPANLNRPGEMFLPASHNSWTSALVDGGQVIFYNAEEEVVAEVALASYKGVTAIVTYPTGEVSARLVLEHEDENLSIFLPRPMDADDFGFAWEAWLEALDLPARLKRQKDGVLSDEGGTVCGSIMPTRKRCPIQILRPKPRRARSFYRERRPKFLVFRNAAMR